MPKVAASGKLARLTSLMEATQLLNSTLDVDKLLGVILDLAVANLKATRGTIYLIDKQSGELWSRVLKDRKLVEIRLPMGKGIAGHVALTGETVNLKDASRDERFYADFDRRSGFRTRTMLCMPMRNRAGEVIGVFQMLNRRGGPFTRADETFLQAFSTQVALAIENARHHLAVVEKERTEKELQIAARIQESLLPVGTVSAPGYEICASAQPCHTVGGDYYALVPLEGEKVLCVVADVAGKGVPAALLVSMLHAALHVRLDAALDLAVLMQRLNVFLHKNVIPGRYITAFACVLDTRTHRIISVNCGHPPPRLVTDRTLRTLEVGGLPLGLMPSAEYETEMTALAPGETLVAYTDGVTEAFNTKDDDYGMPRLDACLRDGRVTSAAELHARVLADVQSFVGRAPVADDVTLLVVRRQRGAPGR